MSRETAWRNYNRLHRSTSPEAFRVTTDEHTARFVIGKDEEVRDLLDRAGVYRRRFDIPRAEWCIPVGELEGVIAYARAYNGRRVYVDNEFPLVTDSGWAS